ncbi:MAG TPA: DUF2784 domain-containing protein [Casimicrobiaceae bacterium]|jgi:hypothetical protein|nr:DUF2784 domain-containing protein [Casimicrobiaceae bacterium]
MPYRFAADAVLAVHLAFVLFVTCGGLLVLRIPRLAWLHLPAVAWAAFVELSGSICPLTPLELALRRGAGEAGYGGDFFEHYLVALIYPAGLTRELQMAIGAAVLLINLVVYFVLWRRQSIRR